MAAVSQPYSQPKAVELILDEIKKQVRQKSAAPVLLGISGIDCSGKTTLADALMKRVAEEEIRSELVRVDDFIIPPAVRKSGGQAHTDYFENTFDHDAFTKRIRSVAAIPGMQLVVGEGVYLFKREMANMWHTRVWLEMSVEQSVARGTVRDVAFFGSPAGAKIEYLRLFAPAHEYHMERDAPSETAHLVFEVQPLTQ